MNYFAELNAINCNDKVEAKNGLSYLAWAYAWAELKKKHPKSFYTVYENSEGWNYFTDGKTAWVKTGVTVVVEEDEKSGRGYSIEHIEYLPVMDFKNRSIPVEAITSFDVNKSIQRSLTKAVARHGIGLYIYAGEDLPDSADGSAEEKVAAVKAKKEMKKAIESKNEVVKASDLASKEDQDKYKAVCAESNQDYMEIIKAAGYKKGDTITKTLLAAAYMELKKRVK